MAWICLFTCWRHRCYGIWREYDSTALFIERFGQVICFSQYTVRFPCGVSSFCGFSVSFHIQCCSLTHGVCEPWSLMEAGSRFFHHFPMGIRNKQSINAIFSHQERFSRLLVASTLSALCSPLAHISNLWPTDHFHPRIAMYAHQVYTWHQTIKCYNRPPFYSVPLFSMCFINLQLHKRLHQHPCLSYVL